jgi:hypothetical protein
VQVKQLAKWLENFGSDRPDAKLAHIASKKKEVKSARVAADTGLQQTETFVD